MNKITQVVFKDGMKEAYGYGLWQWNYGQVLRIQGLSLPTAAEIHFSLQERNGESVTRIGITKDGVTDVVIPDSMLENEGVYGSEYNLYVFVYLTDEESGRTEYKMTLEVKTRPKPEAFDTPEDAELFREAIAAVNECAERAEVAQSGAESAKEEAKVTADGIYADVQGMVVQATDAKNAAVGYANTASNKADEAETDRLETAQIKAQTEELRQETEKLRQDTLAAEQRVIQLMSTDTKSYFFATIAERDAATGIRQCDRCSVYETRADYIYDTQNIDGDEENPEWIKTSDWDALKSVAWDIITGKPDFAKVALSGKYADLLGIPNRYQSPLVLDGTGETVVWNYSEGDAAVVTLTESKPLEINGAYNGCVAVVQCYGAVLDLSDEIYNKSVTFGYIEPLESEHITYTLIYNAGKWDVTSLVYAGGEAGA